MRTREGMGAARAKAWNSCRARRSLVSRVTGPSGPCCLAAVLPVRRAGRRRRVAVPDLEFREFCRRSELPLSEGSWDVFAAGR